MIWDECTIDVEIFIFHQQIIWVTVVLVVEVLFSSLSVYIYAFLTICLSRLFAFYFSAFLLVAIRIFWMTPPLPPSHPPKKVYKVNYFFSSDRSLIFNKSRALFHLNCFNLVSVITEKSRERKSSNLLQLLQCKATRPATILVEKSSEILVVSDEIRLRSMNDRGWWEAR